MQHLSRDRVCKGESGAETGIVSGTCTSSALASDEASLHELWEQVRTRQGDPQCRGHRTALELSANKFGQPRGATGGACFRHGAEPGRLHEPRPPPSCEAMRARVRGSSAPSVGRPQRRRDRCFGRLRRPAGSPWVRSSVTGMLARLVGATYGSRARLGAAVGGVALLATGQLAAEAKAHDPPAELDVDGVGGQVYSALVNRKVNACPMAIRVAWHASGTYDEAAATGGSTW